MTDSRRRALVTGSSRGLGSAILGALRAAGWDAHGLARSGDDTTGDVRVTADIETALRDLCDRDGDDGGLDLLVCCASSAVAGYLRDVPVSTALLPLQIDAAGALGAVMCALPRLHLRSGSTIVLVGSMAGLHGVPGFAAYSAAKAAVHALGAALRLEYPTGTPATLMLILGRLEGDAIAQKRAWTPQGEAPLIPMRPFRLFRSASQPLPMATVVDAITENLGRSATLFLPRSLQWMEALARHLPRVFRWLLQLYERRRLPESLGARPAARRGRGRRA